MKKLFKNNLDVFINYWKQCQHIIDLWKLSVDDKLLSYLNMLGIKKPIISTRPVLFSNNKDIANQI